MSAHSRCTPILLTCVLASLPVLIPAAGGESRQRSAAPASAFAKTNLHAWAFEEYDAVSRSPAERAQVLETVGLTKAGYVGRNVERMKEFDAYVAAYNARKIELVAVWTPVNTDSPLQEPQIQMFLEAVERHKLRIQWWVTLEQLKQGGEQTVEKAVTIVRQPECGSGQTWLAAGAVWSRTGFLVHSTGESARNHSPPATWRRLPRSGLPTTFTTRIHNSIGSQRYSRKCCRTSWR